MNKSLTATRSFLLRTRKLFAMTKLHVNFDGNPTPSGAKVCIFGATAPLATQIAAAFTPFGFPTVMVHRNPLDTFSHQPNEVEYIASNPGNRTSDYWINWENSNIGLADMRQWTEIGQRYFQLVHDLTNEWDVENSIKDCDIVINCIGSKKTVRPDEHYEQPNVEIPRAIAKACADRSKHNVKKLIHFSAAGASPDAVSRRLRTKWQGEQEVLKYFPEATIIRPTQILGMENTNNFLG